LPFNDELARFTTYLGRVGTGREYAGRAQVVIQYDPGRIRVFMAGHAAFIVKEVNRTYYKRVCDNNCDRCRPMNREPFFPKTGHTFSFVALVTGHLLYRATSNSTRITKSGQQVFWLKIYLIRSIRNRSLSFVVAHCRESSSNSCTVRVSMRLRYSVFGLKIKTGPVPSLRRMAT